MEFVLCVLVLKPQMFAINYRKLGKHIKLEVSKYEDFIAKYWDLFVEFS